MRQLLKPPNLLTLARLLAAPLVAGCIVHEAYGLALVLLAVAGFTDALDGLLARRFGWSTQLGAYIDPIADKILLVTVYVSLGMAGLIPPWLVIVVLGRDLLILMVAAGALLGTQYRGFEPSVWGKLSTLVQILTGVMVLGSRVFPWPMLTLWAGNLPVITAIVTAWSGLHYAWRFAQTLRANRARGFPEGSTRG
jgi:cardiolipin synthase